MMGGRPQDVRRWAEAYSVPITVTDSSEPKSQTATTKFGLVVT